ncbi:hypothetical protein BM221_008919 [Beauveria bassiana]|uniref:Uncharacterized protein n=1 Tax=Beauveria bassiana TaxID=176275 RepID=A0A2N6NE62_BEABA|nr:hypothetical protein BM221_008919 [Beauveria bassiana]
MDTISILASPEARLLQRSDGSLPMVSDELGVAVVNELALQHLLVDNVVFDYEPVVLRTFGQGLMLRRGPPTVGGTLGLVAASGWPTSDPGERGRSIREDQ